MGAAISENTADMAADVFNSTTSNTNSTNTNVTNDKQERVLDNCDLFTEGGSADLSQNASQALNIQQYNTSRNKQQATNLINQKMLQAAQSTVSGYGIGIAAAINNMNMVTNVTTSMQSNINESNRNVVDALQSFSCINSTIDTGGGPLTMAQNNNQDIIAAQTNHADNWQSIVNNISQSAQQTASASVTGFSIGGILMAVLGAILVLVLVVTFAKMANKNSDGGGEGGGGGGGGESAIEGDAVKAALLGGAGGTKIAGLPIGLWIFYSILMIALIVMGSIGLYERTQYRCSYDSQCNYIHPWTAKPTTDGLCSCEDHLACALKPDWAHSAVVAPPLFMCNMVQSNIEFGSSDSNDTVLMPGALQYMALMSAASYSAGSPEANNNGYNCGVFNRLLNLIDPNITPDTVDPSAMKDRAKYAVALADYVYRQMISPENSDSAMGTMRLVPPDGRPDKLHWCSARILVNLIPVQPFFAAPYDPDGILAKGSGDLSALDGKTCTPFGAAAAGTAGNGTAGPSAAPAPVRTLLQAGTRKYGARLRSVAEQAARKTGAPADKAWALGVDAAAKTFLGKDMSVPDMDDIYRRVYAARRSKAVAQAQGRCPSPTKPAAARMGSAPLQDDSLPANWAPVTGQQGSGTGQSPSGINIVGQVCYKKLNAQVGGKVGNSTTTQWLFKPSTVGGTCDTGFKRMWSAGQPQPNDAGNTEDCASFAKYRSIMQTTTIQSDDGGNSMCFLPNMAWDNGDPNATYEAAAASYGTFGECHGTALSGFGDCGGTGLQSGQQLSCIMSTLNQTENQYGGLAAMTFTQTMPGDGSDFKKNVYVAGIAIDTSDVDDVFSASLGNVVPGQSPAVTSVTGGADARCMSTGTGGDLEWFCPTDADSCGQFDPAARARPSAVRTEARQPLRNLLGDAWDGNANTVSTPGKDVDGNSPGTAGVGGTYNPYCNMIAGFCSTDPADKDYDPTCLGAAHANYVTKGSGTSDAYFNKCYHQPVQLCTLYQNNGTSDSSAGDDAPAVFGKDKECSTVNKGACWNRALCSAVGASWEPVLNGGGVYQGHICTTTPSCPSSKTNTSQQSTCDSCATKTSCNAKLMVPLAHGQKSSDNPCSCCNTLTTEAGCTAAAASAASCKDGSGGTCDCAWGPVPQVVAENDVTGGMQGCKMGCSAKMPSSDCGWDDQRGECILACDPNGNVCDNCTSTGCTPPCFWTSDPDKTAACSKYTLESDCLGQKDPSGLPLCHYDADTTTCTLAAGACTLGPNVCNTDPDPPTAGMGAGMGMSAGAGQRRPAFTKLTAALPSRVSSGYAQVQRMTRQKAEDDRRRAAARPRPHRALNFDGTAGYCGSSMTGASRHAASVAAGPEAQGKEPPVTAAELAEAAAASYKDSLNDSLRRLYCVRLPSAFVNSDSAGQKAQQNLVNGCLPNVFKPLSEDEDLHVFYNKCGPLGGADKPGNRTDCCYAVSDGSLQFGDNGGNNQPKPLLSGTCYSDETATDPTTLPPPTFTNYTCGCPGQDGPTSTTCMLHATTNDHLCWVNPQQAGGAGGGGAVGHYGGFLMRQASTFGGADRGGTHGLYATSGGTTGLDEDMYDYAALPSTNVVTWTQMNRGARQQRRLFMFLRIYYWIILSHGTNSQTMTELGVSTFLNNGGWDTHTQKPVISITDAHQQQDLAETAFYDTQPLLVYGKDTAKTPYFYTLQELKEGIYEADPVTGKPKSKPTAIKDADYYMGQLSMWTYNEDTDGLSGEPARDGMSAANPSQDSSDPAAQIEEGQQLRGLLQGTYGYCELWFTNSQFIGGTLGSAAGMLALIVIYLVARHYMLKARR
jgi:hypothetical protein